MTRLTTILIFSLFPNITESQIEPDSISLKAIYVKDTTYYKNGQLEQITTAIIQNNDTLLLDYTKYSISGNSKEIYSKIKDTIGYATLQLVKKRTFNSKGQQIYG